MTDNLNIHRPENLDGQARPPRPVASIDALGEPIPMTWRQVIEWATRIGFRFSDNATAEQKEKAINKYRIDSQVPPFRITDKKPVPRKLGHAPRKRLLALA